MEFTPVTAERIPLGFTPYRFLPAVFLADLSSVLCRPSSIFCLLPTAHCLLPTVYSLLPTVYCLLSTLWNSALRTSEGLFHWGNHPKQKGLIRSERTHPNHPFFYNILHILPDQLLNPKQWPIRPPLRMGIQQPARRTADKPARRTAGKSLNFYPVKFCGAETL